MTSNLLTPILLIGFNRPNTLNEQLQRIDQLKERTVYISIDGLPNKCSEGLMEAWQSCVSVAKSWSLNTQHNALLVIHPENLGLYDHFKSALMDFFGKFPVGIVLEDDIVFVSEFINFVDENHALLFNGDCWSIEGNNPLGRHDLVFAPKDVVVAFQQTYIHTISGWASSTNNVQVFIDFCDQRFSWTEVVGVISRFSRKVTRDPVLRVGIQATWLRKMKRARAKGLAGSWDNTWELAGWSSQLPSVMPNFSLSRESSDQVEGQSHPHSILGDPWNSNSLPTSISVENDIYTLSRKSDLSMLSIWGIRRAYCWIFFLRLLKQRRNLINSHD